VAQRGRNASSRLVDRGIGDDPALGAVARFLL